MELGSSLYLTDSEYSLCEKGLEQFPSLFSGRRRKERRKSQEEIDGRESQRRVETDLLFVEGVSISPHKLRILIESYTYFGVSVRPSVALNFLLERATKL